MFIKFLSFFLLSYFLSNTALAESISPIEGSWFPYAVECFQSTKFVKRLSPTEIFTPATSILFSFFTGEFKAILKYQPTKCALEQSIPYFLDGTLIRFYNFEKEIWTCPTKETEYKINPNPPEPTSYEIRAASSGAEELLIKDSKLGCEKDQESVLVLRRVVTG